MKINKIIFYVFFMLLLTGCSPKEQYEIVKEEVTPSKELLDYLDAKYGDEFDWTILDGEKQVSQNKVNSVKDYLEQYERVGLNLEPHVGEYLTIYNYNLGESCISDGRETKIGLTVIKDQNNDKIIGDFLNVEDSIPGLIQTDSIDKTFDNMNCTQSE